jgi:coenzyme F420-dependent glucose-6-phosphate dehydrogenase
MRLGYHLSSEEHDASTLVRLAARAEEVGFGFATIADHFHPWTDAQGQSPFVWGVLGGIAATTSTLRVGTAVTCPLIRTHPAIVAQAAATAAAMFGDRFFLGLGTGENLNEHVTGQRWPPVAIRREMLEEAASVIRLLWQGGLHSHHGRYYTVENARIYTLPAEPPPIYVAAAGPASSQLAGKIGDGLIAVAPQEGTVRRFQEAGGRGKPCIGQIHVCWAASEADARRLAHAVWPNAAIPGQLGQELALPTYFEQAAEPLREEDVARVVVCGPDPEAYATAIRTYEEAGFDQLSIHQIGPDQEGFFGFFERELLPLSAVRT